MAEILRFPDSVENVADRVFVRITNFKPEFGGLGDFTGDAMAALNAVADFSRDQANLSDISSIALPAADRARRELFALTGGTSQFTMSLPLPTGFSVNGSIVYATEQAGIIGAGADFIAGEIEFDGDNILGDALAVFRSATGRDQNIGSGLRAVMGRARRETANKREFKLFEGVPMRSFSFSFSLVPSNQKESDNIHRMIYLMRKAASPSLTRNTLQFKHPDYFDVSIVSPGAQMTALNQDGWLFRDAGIIKMPRCVCESITVAYNSGEFSYFKSDGMPTKVDFTLNFKELEAINKQRILEGF